VKCNGLGFIGGFQSSRANKSRPTVIRFSSLGQKLDFRRAFFQKQLATSIQSRLLTSNPNHSHQSVTLLLGCAYQADFLWSRALLFTLYRSHLLHHALLPGHLHLPDHAGEE